MFNLTGRFALVTGASGGIGGSIAKALSDAGAKVALSGTRVEALEKTAADIGGSPVILPCNLADPVATAALVGQAEEALGGLDIIISNAGLTKDGLLMRMKDEDWETVLKVNLESYFHDLRGAEPNAVYDMVVNAVERPMLEVVMKQADGNQTVAAEILGISRGTLRRKLADYGLC